ncbi:hypothetical protein FGG23_gp081 [Mycobacterium phage Ibhubesi]|uniref:Ead/Ea22-like family protein n=1 Tax=Mycobacterium phage Ibhubesi TaxID=2922205 RepID=G1D327_9CAUD|nr:hypothetical protein FGG23_gp081 [Mycobacterium phage Ibhubesi]AEK09177.1 hypothetical protein PBI_IBHUBESI_81 [Mycobacterium phage Ibhubesi]
MSDVVERAKVALEGVAYGPWEFDCSDEGMQAVGGPVIWLGDGDLGFRVEAHYQDDRNAEFVAQARTLVPELIAEVERKSAQLAEWRAQYDAIDAENERLRAALGDAWDDGNATGLDGWIGPGIGDSRGVDDQAVYNRNRFLDAALGKGASHGPLYPYKILAALDTEGEA